MFFDLETGRAEVFMGLSDVHFGPEALLSRHLPSLISSVMQNLILKIRSLTDTRGQDLIEYALMAGFVAVAAGATMPGVADSISTIFSQVASVMDVASTQGN